VTQFACVLFVRVGEHDLQAETTEVKISVVTEGFNDFKWSTGFGLFAN